ncbi:MAG: radical SAM/SPASM domain-containing protein [bacterium]
MSAGALLRPDITQLGDLLANRFEPDLRHVATIAGLEARLENPDIYPMLAAITPTEYCNYRCRTCHTHSPDFGSDEYNRYYAFYKDPEKFKLGFMQLETYDRLLDEIMEFKGVTGLYLGTTGEPTLHRDFRAMIAHAAHRGLMVTATTNGVLLAPEQVPQLVGAGLRYIDVSIDAATEETYKKLRGGDYRRLEKVVQSAVKAARGGRVWISVNMTVQDENETETRQFVDRWINEVDFIGVWGCHLKKRYVSNWNRRPEKRTLCKQLYSGIGVSTDGHVWACCGGGPMEGCIGMWDGTRSLREIWTDPNWSALRKEFFEGRWSNVPMCNDCDVWMLNSLTRFRIDGDLMIETRPTTSIYRKIRPETKLAKLGRYIRIGIANPAQARSKLRAILRERRMRGG